MQYLVKLLTTITLFSSFVYGYTVTEDALMSQKKYTISGTFGQHDFSGAESAFDWAFTTSKGTSYQLQGNAPTDSDVFGWKEVSIATPTPAWYMFSLGSDVDGDGNQKFDWVLLSTNESKKSAYKLAGVAGNGTFEYSSKLNIDYRVSGSSITIAKIGGLDDSTADGALLVGNWAGIEGYNTFSFFEDGSFIATRYSDDEKTNDGAVAGTYRYESSTGQLWLDMDYIGSNLDENIPDESITIIIDAYSMRTGDGEDELYYRQPVSNSIEATWHDTSNIVMLLDDGRLLYVEADGGSGDGFEAGSYTYNSSSKEIRLGAVIYDDSVSANGLYGSSSSSISALLNGNTLVLKNLMLERAFIVSP